MRKVQEALLQLFGREWLGCTIAMCFFFFGRLAFISEIESGIIGTEAPSQQQDLQIPQKSRILHHRTAVLLFGDYGTDATWLIIPSAGLVLYHQKKGSRTADPWLFGMLAQRKLSNNFRSLTISLFTQSSTRRVTAVQKAPETL